MRLFIPMIIVLLVALSLATAQAAKSNQDCVIPLVSGEEVLQPYPFEIPKNTKVFKLGKGTSGGTVYRAIFSDGKTKILKVYNTSFSNNNEIEPSMRVDLARLNTLREIIGDDTVSNTARFKIAKASIFSKNTMEMEDTRGMPLDKLLEDPSIPYSEKQSIFKKYQSCLQDLFIRLKQKHPNASLRFDGLIRLDESENVHSRFFIKKDNVLVTSSAGLVIVDPY